MNDKILTFLHSGACGDCVASMSTVKELCEIESAKAVLVLDPTGGFLCNDDDLNDLIRKQTQGRGYVFSEKRTKINELCVDFCIKLCTYAYMSYVIFAFISIFDFML